MQKGLDQRGRGASVLILLHKDLTLGRFSGTARAKGIQPEPRQPRQSSSSWQPGALAHVAGLLEPGALAHVARLEAAAQGARRL